jgi:hypothetical protein
MEKLLEDKKMRFLPSTQDDQLQSDYRVRVNEA